MTQRRDAVPDMPDALLDRARRLVASGHRRILGIVGLPGGGKSTLAAALVDYLGSSAVRVPMDGFHLANSELARLGATARKGAPDTFDVLGYVDLLGRLRANNEPIVYAPEFERCIEEPIAASIAVPQDVPLVVTEGNYLLLDQEPWSAVRHLIDEVWFVDVPEEQRLERLVARHMQFGKDAAQARAWAEGSDHRNAELVAATKKRADLVCLMGEYPCVTVN